MSNTGHTVTASPERVIESVAYDTASKPYKGFSVRGSYVKESPDAWIEVTRDGAPFRAFSYPAYRIWNIVAHFHEYVDDVLSDDPRTENGKEISVLVHPASTNPRTNESQLPLDLQIARQKEIDGIGLGVLSG